MNGEASPIWRRIVGSVTIALPFFFWMYRGQLDRLTNRPNIVTALVIISILWLIVYRAWPAFEIVWASWRSPDGREAMRPTVRRLAGSVAFAALILLLLLGFMRTLSSQIEVYPWALARSLLVLSVVGYLVGPGLAAKWRRWRARLI